MFRKLVVGLSDVIIFNLTHPDGSQISNLIAS